MPEFSFRNTIRIQEGLSIRLRTSFAVLISGSQRGLIFTNVTVGTTLITAEGGTSYGHAVTLARSHNIEGPYEVHPQNPIMTSVRDRNAFNQAMETGSPISTALHDGLQKAGHGSMCPWKEDEWILAHLCARPLYGTYYCPLGRETSLQKLVWKEDDWPYTVNGLPEDRVFFSGMKSNVEDESVDIPKVKKYDDFDYFLYEERK